MLGFKLVVIAATVGAVVAQNLPTCASSCIGGDNYGTGCTKLDVACICNSSSWIAGLACCVSKTCSTADQDETIKFANKICAGAGVTTLPQTATCASTASGAASSGLASGAAISSATASTVATTTASSVVASSVAASSNVGGSAAAVSTAPSSSRGAAAIQTAGVGMGAILAGLAVAL